MGAIVSNDHAIAVGIVAAWLGRGADWWRAEVLADDAGRLTDTVELRMVTGQRYRVTIEPVTGAAG